VSQKRAPTISIRPADKPWNPGIEGACRFADRGMAQGDPDLLAGTAAFAT